MNIAEIHPRSFFRPPGRLTGADGHRLLSALSDAIAATSGQHDREASFPFENFALLHQHGLLALTIGRDFGGDGADLPTTLEVVRAVAKGDAATALVLVMQYLFHAAMPIRDIEPSVYRRIARDAVEQGALINALRVEPDLGSPARGGLPATLARRTPEGWRISGHKIFSTGIPALTWLNVWARTDEAEPRTGGFLVHRDSPGIQVVDSWDHLGLRASGSHDVIFDEVLVPADHVLDLRPAGETPPYAAKFALWSAVLTAAIYDATAWAARDWLVGWMLERKPANLGASLSTLPRFQEAIGAIDALLLSNRCLLDSAAAGLVTPVEANLVKHLVTENAIQAVQRGLEISGNPGLSRHNPLERYFRDVLCGRVHTPQGDVCLAGAGRAAFNFRAAAASLASKAEGI
jgi:alkylation response protein AidB-like acyl-CoA dehydrogenase